MGVLGGTTTVLYTSKNCKTGVTGITAKVRKPDGTYLGPFTLTEVVESGFEGSYLLTFNTSTSDPVGDYVGLITEGNLCTPFSKLIQDPNAGGGGPSEVVIPRDDVIFVDIEAETSLIVQLDDLPELQVIIDKSELDFVLSAQSDEISVILDPMSQIDITIEEC
jgi:hypothetical protein